MKELYDVAFLRIIAQELAQLIVLLLSFVVMSFTSTQLQEIEEYANSANPTVEGLMERLNMPQSTVSYELNITM
jgi:hypothetical protein